MSAIKDQAIDVIKSLPEDCTMEDIQHHLYVCEKVRRGIRAIDEGRVCSQDEAELKVKAWLESSGPSQP